MPHSAPDKPLFDNHEQERYQRHLQLPNFGPIGQNRCRASHIVIVGMGGLGCPVALYLTAAGVGTLTLVDADDVSLSNLQRQILFTEDDIGIKKVAAAAQRLSKHNHLVSINTVGERLSPTNAKNILRSADLVIDCTDNFYARYLINDICHQMSKPWIYSSVLGQQGQVVLFEPKHSCFRCLFPKLNNAPDCNQAGVLGVMPGMMGVMQASLALEHLCANTEREHNELHQVSNWPFTSTTIKLHKSPDCALCQGTASKEQLTAAYKRPIPSLDKAFIISTSTLTGLRENNNTVMVDVRSKQDFEANNLGGINIPLAHLSSDFRPKQSHTYVLYCQTGKRSEWAVAQLLSEDPPVEITFNIYSLEGGIDATR
jgi:adenylyltransferase/sulfurtransferase